MGDASRNRGRRLKQHLLMMSIMITFMISVLYKVKAFGVTHVKVSREQVAEHRIRILAAAACLFRQRGFDDVTVAEVMKDAGLTHGAFYDGVDAPPTASMCQSAGVEHH